MKSKLVVEGSGRVVVLRKLYLIFSLCVFTCVWAGVQAQTLGTPPNITDAYAASNQVGYCIDSGGSGSCTANDFLITSIDILNVDDGCSGPDDYMQIDATVFFNKATPQRNDVTVWFYRGDDQATLPNPDFVAQNARIGDFCNRVSLESGLDITRQVAPFDVLGQSGLLDPDSCADVPNTAKGDLEQVISDLVLPCRDIGTPDPNDPQGAPLSNVPDGIIDVSGCTSWDNNAGTFCDGPEYDGVGEPAAGTGSKCNCGEFSGITTQVGLPDISVTKVCSPTDVAPGDATSCTIEIINAGNGTQIGATAAGLEGFFYEDDYPENQGSITNVVTTQGSVVDGFTLDANGVSTANQSLNIYPGDVLGGTTLTITYDFVTSPLLPSTITTITNIVCASYFDIGEDGSPEVFSYAFDPDLCATEEVTTPVTIAGVDIQVLHGGMQFDWVTASETNNLGFNIYVLRGQTYFKLNDELIPSESITTLDESRYSLWLDAGIDAASHRFFIEDVDLQGKATKNGPFRLSKGSTSSIPSIRTNWQAIASELDSARNGKKARFKSKKSPANATTAGNDVINIEVATSGLQRLSLSDIELQGVAAADMSRGRYSLTDSTGTQIASRVTKGVKGEPGYFEFVGEARKTFYSAASIYQLRYSSKTHSALTIGTISGKNNKAGSAGSVSSFYMHTEEVEVDAVYVNSSRVENDPWMMRKLFANGSPAIDPYDVPVSNVYEGGVATLISATVAGGIDFNDLLDHSVQLRANSELIDSHDFGGTEAATLAGESLTSESANSVAVEIAVIPNNSFGVDLVYTNKVSVTYPRRYVAINNQLSFESSDDYFVVADISSDSAQVFAEGENGLSFLGDFSTKGEEIGFSGVPGATKYYLFGRGTASKPLLSAVASRDITALGVENIVIAHPSFIGAELEAYVESRTALGKGASSIVSTEEIYTNYSGGVRDAIAIHEFIIDYYSKNNDLVSVLIVGGDSYDYHDNLGIGAISFVPTLYKPTGDLIQFSPVDSLFGDIDRDLVPDIPVGRLPVRSLSELSTILDKSKLFAQQLGSRSALLVADEMGENNAYNFTEHSENVAATLIPQAWDVTRAYIDVLGPLAARTALLDGLSEGPRLALYTGHSSTNVWSGRRLFTYADTLALGNDQRPSAYLQWGCYNTYFSSPTSDTMSHGLMLAGEQGAAIVIGSSTLTNARAEARFSVLLQNELLKPNIMFGEALISAKQTYYSETGLVYKGILLGVTLLGDPLLRL